MNIDNVVIATDEGFVVVAEVDGVRGQPGGWGVTVFRYGDRYNPAAENLRVADAITDTEANARLIATALSHAHICPDCQQSYVEARGAKRANN